MPQGNEIITFGENIPDKLSRGRKLAARRYVEEVLADSSKEAIVFQRQLLNDEDADRKLRFQASEAILDRFMGKAAQELRLGESEDRPIVFSDKLKRLREGMEAAIDAVTRPAGDTPIEAFERKVTEDLVDGEGVSI